MSNTFSILLIGETGSGKSTLINTLTNYFLGGTISNIKVAIKTKFLEATEKFKSSETDSSDRTKSQTDSCNNYSFKKEGKNFVFIDTPGLSDTRGVKQDDINLGKIIDAAENCTSLSAIIIIVNGTVPRMTINLQNVIARLRGSIPDSLLNNLMVVFTNCLSHTRNFDVNSLEITLNPENILHMNNTAFSTDPKNWDDVAKKSLINEFECSFMTFGKILEVISKMDNVSTKDFGEMKKHRFQIKSILHQAKVDIGNLQKLQDSIQIHAAQMEKASKDKESFKNFTKTNTITSNELVPAQYHSTICSECNFVCHDRCGLGEISTKGDNAFLNCYAMGGTDLCRNCPGKCKFTLHYHDKKTMKQVTKTVEEELKDLKQKYLNSVQMENDAKNKITSVDSARKIMDAALKKMTNDISDSCRRLKKICSGFNLVDELHITLNQMEMEAKQHTSHDARKSADEMIKTIRAIADQLNKETSFQTKKTFTKIDESKIARSGSNEKSKDEKTTKKGKEGKETEKRDNGDSISFKCPKCKSQTKLPKPVYQSLEKANKPILCQKCYKSKKDSDSEDEESESEEESSSEEETTKEAKKTKKGKENKETEKKDKGDSIAFKCEKCKSKAKLPKSVYESLEKAKRPKMCQKCYKSKKDSDSEDEESESEEESSSEEESETRKDSKNVSSFNCSECKKKAYLPKDIIESIEKSNNPLKCKKCYVSKKKPTKTSTSKSPDVAAMIEKTCGKCSQTFKIKKEKDIGKQMLCKKCFNQNLEK